MKEESHEQERRCGGAGYQMKRWGKSVWISSASSLTGILKPLLLERCKSVSEDWLCDVQLEIQ